MNYFQKFIAVGLLAFIFNSCEKEALIDNGGVVVKSVSLPQVSIVTFGQTIVDEPKIDAQMKIEVDGEIDYEGNIGIEIRGKSSQFFFPKKQYGFETRDAANEDLDVSLLGFPEEEDWILHAPYSDKTLLRNVLMYDFSNEMNRYASKTKFVEVTINNEYNGVYVLMEKLKRDANRIDINKLKTSENSGEDLTGGYILKIDKSDGATESSYDVTNSFSSLIAPPGNISPEGKINFLYGTPDKDEITETQKKYINDYINSFEKSLVGSDFKDPVKGYANYIDTESFIDFFILNELSNNIDGYRLSTFITKDKNEKLKMGPIWDFNLAFGNADYCNGIASNVWAYKLYERCPGGVWQVPFWWGRLLEDPNFVTLLKARWNSLRANTLATPTVLQKIDEYENLLHESGALTRNFKKWPIFKQYVWPNAFIGNDYKEEKKFLVDWLTARLTWMDAGINGL